METLLSMTKMDFGETAEAAFLIQEQQEAPSPHITSDKLHNLIFHD
jgi:hypothetical protein